MSDNFRPNESATPNEELFETRHIDLAAALLLMSYPIVELTQDAGTFHSQYRFADSPELRDIVARFHDDALMVSAKAYGNRLYRLRARVRAHHDAQRLIVGAN